MKSVKSTPISLSAPSPVFSIKKILVPIDFSPASDQAFTYASQLSREFEADLILLHVLEPTGLPVFEDIPQAPAFLKKASADAEKALRDLSESLGDETKKRISWAIRNGLAAHEINDVAKEIDADLVVIGSHGLTSGKHFCIGTTSERVARAAPCSVLVVREKEYELSPGV